MLFNLNGQWLEQANATIPFDDGALLFGDSLFETLRARNREILLTKDHLDRLELSCRLLAFPWDRDRITTALNELCDRLPDSSYRVRITLSRGRAHGLSPDPAETGWFSISCREYIDPSAEEQSHGVDAVYAANRRVNPLSHLPQLKRGSYVDCLYAARFAQQHGAREALFQEPDGTVLEGATSNMVVCRGGTLLTPPPGELVLAGVMLRQIRDTAHPLSLDFQETPINEECLLTADEVMICNSLIGILPLRSLSGRPLNQCGMATRIRTALQERGAW